MVGEHQLLVTSNGVFRPFALVEGRADAAALEAYLSN